jgi:hypothetical protein
MQELSCKKTRVKNRPGGAGVTNVKKLTCKKHTFSCMLSTSEPTLRSQLVYGHTTFSKEVEEIDRHFVHFGLRYLEVHL